MKSLIGYKYKPFDNSHEVNLTNLGRGIRHETLLAGTQHGITPKICTIVSEPFYCDIKTIADLHRKLQMILVSYNNETISTLFHRDAIIDFDPAFKFGENVITQ